MLDVGFAQSSQFLLAVYPHHGIVGGFEQRVAPLLLQFGDAEVDGLHALLLVVGQQRTLAHELLVGFFQEFLVLALKRVFIVFINLTDALEERHVEGNLVLQFGQHRHHFLLNLAELRCFVCFGQGKEHAAHAVEQSSALLVGQDGVLESGRIGIVHDFGNVVAVLLDGCLEGRQIVSGLDLAEVGCSVRQRALLQQGVLLRCLLATADSRSQCCSNRNGHDDVLYFHKFDSYLMISFVSIL